LKSCMDILTTYYIGLLAITIDIEKAAANLMTSVSCHYTKHSIILQ